MVAELLLLAVVSVVGLLIVVDTLRVGAPPMPTRPGVAAVMIGQMPATVSRVHELGAGFGGLCLGVARARPDAEVHGWEKAWVPWLVASVRAHLWGRGRVHIHFGDLLDAPHEQADVSFVYVDGSVMERLAPALRRRLRPEAVVISNSFALPHWSPARSIELDDALRTKVLVYRLDT